MHLVIKGNSMVATQAALRRGIPVRVLKRSQSGAETIAAAPRRYRDAIVAWFCEPFTMQTGFGAPLGTLLLYRDPQLTE